MDTKEFSCARCGYSSDIKANYIAHLKSKKPCKTTLSAVTREELLIPLQKPPRKNDAVECEWCKKEISKCNMSRHRNICSDKPSTSKQASVPVIDDENLKVIVNSIMEGFNTLAETIKTCMKSNENMTSSTQNTNNSTQNVNNSTQNINYTTVVQNNYVVNNFGNEDISHLSHDFLSHCLMNPTKGLTSLIDTIHYNAEKPCNHNVRFKSTKQNTMEKFIDSHWMECDATNTLDELIRKGYRVLNAHYTEHFMNDPEYQENEMKQRALERFRFLSDKTCNDYYSVKRDLRCLVKDRTVYVLEPPS